MLFLNMVCLPFKLLTFVDSSSVAVRTTGTRIPRMSEMPAGDADQGHVKGGAGGQSRRGTSADTTAMFGAGQHDASGRANVETKLESLWRVSPSG
jgi:hypothetical protein